MRQFRLFLCLTFLPAALTGQQSSAVVPQTGRFDLGKMWTFEYPPSEYFSTTYGFSGYNHLLGGVRADYQDNEGHIIRYGVRSPAR